MGTADRATPSPIGDPFSGATGTPVAVGENRSGGLHAAQHTPPVAALQFPRLGRYQLLSRLAVGGMAEVYLARHGELSGFKTLVVIKRVLPHLVENPDFIAMFLDEARIASMLDHPNIVRISEVGRVDNEYFLAMELVQGKPLSSLLHRVYTTKVPLPHKLAALVIANAAGGLDHAHRLTDNAGQPLGLVHRDVSPQNIMISFEGQVKVIDFGIARALGRIADTTTRSLKGKLGYMAPEQARSEPVDPRADIFSLGVSLWESLAGRRLFMRETDYATLQAVVMDPIPAVTEFAEVDPQLAGIVKQALMRDPGGRFQSADQLRFALEKFIFSSGGTSSHELGALMKAWFPSDHQEWQRAARLALDMQDSDPPLSMSIAEIQGTPSAAKMSYVVQTPILTTPTPVLVPSANLHATNTQVTIPNRGVPQRLIAWFKTPWRRVGIIILLLLVNIVGLGLFLLSPAPPTLPARTAPETSVPTRPTVESLPSPAALATTPTPARTDPLSDQVQGKKKRIAPSKKKAILGGKATRHGKAAKAGKRTKRTPRSLKAPLRPNPF
jgi:serine/threonine protein kinase